ncbi:IS5 family transposase [Verminephrobacter aporrectodeae subsp. tuberculatae]|uniref:IS5 family transposase n=1 Tax=Verminephrobacter aporrectodeae subsp. tuberculatae TaxID=1110392 RepID=A0ABT3KV25_9BURK|nr:IS5 family transposase [Verminephrobacter aporrectodeae subsp. tuberculatae]MCW5288599.1 IS5 family transposase [Verminephrobacter aporrectodeae subsp. tuberculatae]MCW5322188.1 IS5 family transposase [Verminephrobacter aporrectodeae subsp. tuberculatae]MCW8176650.1 IS5 family transposase [Verminephrobacter aporrectodeae subsp. tuberculatae]MCW8199385.1 IS5 family transposase [Verminephrobacter aporrectodeae subsp. tuberculatae]
MRRDTSQRTEPRATYRVRNWAQYNAGLIARGDVAMWIDESLLTPASAAAVSRRGHPLVYPDAVIQGLLSLKQVFDLPLRALQGFAQSLHRLAFPNLPVPGYTTLSRRAQSLQVVLPALRPGEPLHLAVDSTGLKLCGEGEWKVRTHGWPRRRTWRKVHLAMDTRAGPICAALMTHQEMGDSEALTDLLEQIPFGTPIDIVGGDGACDTKACHAQIAACAGVMPWPQATLGAT